jgi:hypothetical protein
MTVVFIVFLHSAFAQSNHGGTVKVMLPQLDSMVIDLNKLYLNPHSIKEIYVLKDADVATKERYKGALSGVFFKKLPKLVLLTSLAPSKDSTKRKMYVIDGAVIFDVAGVKIDSLNVKTLTVIDTEKLSTFNTFCAPPSFIYIITTKHKAKRPKALKTNN